MNIDDFVQKETNDLIEQLSRYLEQVISDAQLQSHIDRVFDKWDILNIDASTPYTKGEKEFWCAVWSSQHLGSDDHWADGVAQPELGLLLSVLKGEATLPDDYIGRRP